MNSFEKIKAVFFDWDNTLVDAWPVLLAATNITRQKFGLETVSLAQIKILARQSTREGFPKTYGENWQQAQNIFYNAINKHAKLLKVFPQTPSLLQKLKSAGIKIALISNKLNTLLHSEVQEMNLQFDIVLGAGDAQKDKPHPEMGIVALKKLNLQPNEVIYIGDSVTDWLFAKSLNMPAIAIGDDEYQGSLMERFATPEIAFDFLIQNLTPTTETAKVLHIAI
jgi:phosphoglycolate phosphatase